MKQAWLFATLFFVAIPATADQIQYLGLPQQSLSAFALAIDGAKTSIDISTFIFESCDISVRALTAELEAKAQAGVHVRVLLDDLQESAEERQNLADEFAGYGIELRYFSTSLVDIDTRLHAKFMVVDGQSYIFGGRNFSDEYFALSPMLNYVDSDLWVTGASAAHAQAAFDGLWNSDMASVQYGSGDEFVDWSAFCSAELATPTKQLQTYLRRNAAALVQAIPDRNCNVQFAVDNADFSTAQFGQSWDNGNGAHGFMSKARLNRKSATQTVLNFLKGTHKSLYVENYVYMPITELESAFAALRSKGIPVRLLINQDIEPEALISDAEEYELQVAHDRDSVGSEWEGLVSSQGSLRTTFSMSPAGTPFYIHSKAAVRDQNDVLIGSFNMDSRSANINVEAAAVIPSCSGLVEDVMGHYDLVYGQYQHDLTSGDAPPAPQPDFIAQFIGDLLLYQF